MNSNRLIYSRILIACIYIKPRLSACGNIFKRPNRQRTRRTPHKSYKRPNGRFHFLYMLLMKHNILMTNTLNRHIEILLKPISKVLSHVKPGTAPAVSVYEKNGNFNGIIAQNIAQVIVMEFLLFPSPGREEVAVADIRFNLSKINKYVNMQ